MLLQLPDGIRYCLLTFKHHYMRKRSFDFDVALSFAGEQRAFAEGVATHLKRACIRYYYDKHLNAWGAHLQTHLSEVYREQAALCVIFVSREYKEKVWTQHELAAALVRALEDKSRYILPFRFDDTDIEELRNISHYTRKEYDEHALAQKIIGEIRSKAPLVYRLRKVRCFFKRWSGWLTGLVITGLLTFVLYDRLTPVDILADRIYERSRYRSVRCNDGSFSRSLHGRGTCSHHGGVDTGYASDTTRYEKTMAQCRKEAVETSWWPE